MTIVTAEQATPAECVTNNQEIQTPTLEQSLRLTSEVSDIGVEAVVDAVDNGNGEGAEDDDTDNSETQDIRARNIRHWQENPFAVGCVNVDWKDDRISCIASRGHIEGSAVDSQVCLSAYCCGCLGAGRVGNLAVLAQVPEEYDHIEVNEETGESTIVKRKRPRLLWVVGPYWPVNMFLTYPLILGISFWTGWSSLPGAPLGVTVSWSICTFLLLFSLAMVACRNPGVLHRHPYKPPDCDDWRWNDQARTFRPPKARFDPECQVVIEGFDHTCPWTGTAIGSRNMFWFRIFVIMVPICIAYAVILQIFI